MIDGLISGKVFGTPKQCTAKTGSVFALAKVRCTIGDGGSIFVNVIAFDVGACTSLVALGDGDSVSISGTLTPKVWTDKAGATRPSLDIVAQAVLTPYHAKRKRKAVTAEPVHRQQDDFPESESLDF